MLRGALSRAEQTARQRRGGLTTLARLGGEAMTAPARTAFRKRFEREALEYAAAHGQTLTPQQLDQATTARLEAHMALMTEARLRKRRERRELEPSEQPKPTAKISPWEPRASQRTGAGTTPAIVVRPIQLCVGCWIELCPDSPFPTKATSILCARHLEAYTAAAGAPTATSSAASPVPTPQPTQPTQPTRHSRAS